MFRMRPLSLIVAIPLACFLAGPAFADTILSDSTFSSVSLRTRFPPAPRPYPYLAQNAPVAETRVPACSSS